MLCALCGPAVKHLFNRPEAAGPDAGFALGTKVRVDLGRLLLFPGNGLARAGLETEAAHLAFFFDHLEADQGRTDQRRTMLILDMFLVLMPEMAQRRKHRVEASRNQAPAAFLLHDTDAAGPEGQEAFVLAERGNLDSSFFGGPQDHRPRGDGNRDSIDRQIYHSFFFSHQ